MLGMDPAERKQSQRTMNLRAQIDLAAGGPGSGCHGENCGRPSTGRKDPTAIIWTNRLKKAKRMSELLSQYRIGYHKAKTMDDAQWGMLTKAAGYDPKKDFPSEETKNLTLALLRKRFKVANRNK